MRNLLKIFRTESEFSGGSWKLTLPKNWVLMEEDEGVACFASYDGVGALQVSSYLKDGLVTDSDLIEFAQEIGLSKHDLRPATKGEFAGFTTELIDDGTSWRFWYLRFKSTLVCATYNCEADDKSSEEHIVSEILSTLRYREN